MSLLHLYTSVNSHQDIILRIQVAHQLQVRSTHSLIQVWSLNLSQLTNNQCEAYSVHWHIHQCCFCVDCILHILFSSYQISLSLNQSFVAKIRSISISSPCHFYFVLYCFIGFSWSPLPLRSAQSRGPPDLLCPCIFPYRSSKTLVGRYNTRETIRGSYSSTKLTCDKSSVFNGLRRM